MNSPLVAAGSLVFLFRHHQWQSSHSRNEQSSFTGCQQRWANGTPENCVIKAVALGSLASLLPHTIFYRHSLWFAPEMRAFQFYVFCFFFNKEDALGESKLCQSKPFMRHIWILFSYTPGERCLRWHFIDSVLTKGYIYYLLYLKTHPQQADTHS